MDTRNKKPVTRIINCSPAREEGKIRRELSELINKLEGDTVYVQPILSIDEETGKEHLYYQITIWAAAPRSDKTYFRYIIPYRICSSLEEAMVVIANLKNTLYFDEFGKICFKTPEEEDPRRIGEWHALRSSMDRIEAPAWMEERQGVLQG